MRSICGEEGCGEVVISSASADQWWHKPRPDETLADARRRSTPRQHVARPDHTIEHTCATPDPACSGEGCGRGAYDHWLSEQEAKRVRLDEWPMPGLIGR